MAQVEMLDELAAWWRAQLETDKTTLIRGGQAGGDGWNDLQAKLAIIREYESIRRVTDPDVPEDVRDTLGWVMRRLAFGQYAGRPGWVDAWRADGG